MGGSSKSGGPHIGGLSHSPHSILSFRYARFTFAAELLGATAVILFGLCSCRTYPAATADAGVVDAKYNVNVSWMDEGLGRGSGSESALGF